MWPALDQFFACAAFTPPGFGCARLATLAFAPPHPGGVKADGRKTNYRKIFTPPSWLRQQSDFNETQKLEFIDYFNLCAEEFLFQRLGYIYDEVWTSWRNGMLQYGRDPR